jgi:hypothetical protein
LAVTIQPLGQSQTPALDHSTGECALEVWVVRSVAAIAKRDEIRRFIGSTGGTRNQMMNIGFAPGTRVTARPADVAVSGKYNISDVAPSLVLLSHGVVGRWLRQPNYLKESRLQLRHAISQCDCVAIGVGSLANVEWTDLGILQGAIHPRYVALACCEFVVSCFGDKKRRPPETVSGGRVVVSFVVIPLQFPVDLRGPTHNTDAQNIA